MSEELIRQVADELTRRTTAEVRFDDLTRVLYSTDASIYQIEPLGVVIPRTEEDLIAAVEIATQQRIPILPRGGGSSLAGQAVGEALIIDLSKYLNRVLDIDPERRQVTVQPGLTLNFLNRAVAPYGLMYGPDPASGERATLGGIVGNNSTGAHSILYGMTVNHVVALDVVLSDGSLARFDSVDGKALNTRARGNSLEARLYREVPALLDDAAEAIRERFPKHWRRASGYNLDFLLKGLEEGHFNLAQAIVGSEGTLAVVRSITLGLVDRPRHKGLCVVHCDDLIQAMHVNLAALECCQPSAVELLDRKVIELARTVPEYARQLSFVRGNPEALIIVEFYGESEEEVRSRIDQLEAHLRRRKLADTFVRALSPEQQAQVWNVRKVGLGLLMSTRGDYKPIAFIEDASVPPQALPDYVTDILDLMQRTNTRVAMYAHASAGCLHIRPLINLKDVRDVDKMAAISRTVADLMAKYGGAMSGEHGDGLARSQFIERIFGPELYQAFRRLKGTFDPQNLMNPGKIVDAPAMTEHLRYGADYFVRLIPTTYAWDDFQGFDRAVEQCNGAGVCRKLDAGTMCPTFMATRDEKESTRGRANTLRAWMSGKPLSPSDEEVYGVLDLCLGCKGCKSECPSAVDMNKIKTEWMAWYYDTHGLPLRNWIFGHIHQLNALAAPVAPLANRILNARAFKWAAARVLKIHPRRTLPDLADETFPAWWHRRPKRVRQASRGQVVLFPDTFVTYNDPHIGRAAVRLLETAGYEVIVAEKRVCCGRPLLSKGLLKEAQKNAAYNVNLLLPYARQGLPIIGLEPSCILTMRDEYPDLVAGQDAKTVAGQCLTIDEFLADLLRREPDALHFDAPERPVYVHGHCHQKALVGTGPTLEVLRAAGFRVEEIPSGCCGMAGSFGYELEHFDLSVAIAEDRLLPTLRQAPDDAIIVADGTSCRHQIADLSERTGVHLVEVLADALRSPAAS